MQLINLQPMLETGDLPGTIEFYTMVLGFSLEGTFDNGKRMAWCHLQRDNVGIMFTIPNTVMNYPTAMLSGSLYISVNNVDDEWGRLKDTCEIVYPPEDFIYGMREFAIKDNNGYVLNFAHNIL